MFPLHHQRDLIEVSIFSLLRPRKGSALRDESSPSRMHILNFEECFAHNTTKALLVEHVPRQQRQFRCNPRPSTILKV